MVSIPNNYNGLPTIHVRKILSPKVYGGCGLTGGNYDPSRMASIDHEQFTIEAVDESEIQTLIDNSPFGVLTIDVSSHILYANQQVESIFGHSPADLAGEPLDVLIPKRLREAHHESFTNYQETGERNLDWNYTELPGLHADGHEVPLAIMFQEFTYQGQPVFTGIIRDLTRQKRRERELERSNEELEQFAYVVSHDMKEPLRMVSSYLQLLERRYEGELDDEGREFIEYAVDGAQRMRQMIDGLLEYSRLERANPSFEPVDCGDVAETVRGDLRVALSDSDATLEVADLPAVVGDRSQLEQLFRNLVKNGIKHGGDTPTIRITGSSKGDKCQFEVADDGPGIPDDEQEEIFELATGFADDSTGLGLAICRKIVRHHGGEISVDSHDGEGATFRFTLPAATDEPA